MEKKQVIAQILGIMRENEISFEELKQARLDALRPKCTENFDLAVIVDGVAKRVPFLEGKAMDAIGIFPLGGSPTYVEFAVTEPKDYPVELKKRLPGVNTFNLWANIMPELNQKLKELGQPIFDGTYWLDGHEHSGIGYWIGKVVKGKADTTYMDERHKAKVRLIGYI